MSPVCDSCAAANTDLCERFSCTIGCQLSVHRRFLFHGPCSRSRRTSSKMGSVSRG